MSTANLSANHVFGLNTQVKNNILYLDDSTVMYPSGFQIFQYNTESRQQQRFIGVHMNEHEAINYMCMSPLGTVIAVAIQVLGTESTFTLHVGKGAPVEEQKHATIVIYDIHNGKKKRVLTTGDTNGTQEFVSLAFSNDGKYLMAQGSEPDYNVYLWLVEKGKLLTHTKSTTNANAQIHSMSVNPFDTTNYTLCVTGNGLFRVFRYAEAVLKLMHQQKLDRNILCHAWVSDNRVICGTADSKLLLFENSELILEISYVVPHSNSSVNPSISCIVSFSSGLLVGLSTGVGVFFEKTEDNYFYKKAREFLLEESEIGCIALSPHEDMSAVTLKNGQIYLITFDSDSNKSEEVKCDRMAQSFHSGAVVGLDVAESKPLLATCGVDKSIRIWNYVENDVEVVKYFDEIPQCVAIHPNGLYLLAGFPTSLRLMAILIDDIRQYWDSNIRGCKECRFSHGGQHFAAIWNSAVIVYETWSFEVLGHMKAPEGKIKSFAWSADDTKLLITSTEGNVSLWVITTMRRQVEITTVEGESLIVAATMNHTGKQIYTMTENGMIQEYINGIKTKEIQSRSLFNQMIISQTSQFFLGVTPRGGIRSLKFPFLGEASVQTSVDFQDFLFHSGPVNQIRLSFDDQYCFTVGEDGCLWTFKMVDKEGRSLKLERDWSYSDEILVTKSDLRENYRIMNELKQRVDELKAESDAQLRVKDNAYAEKIKEAVEKYTGEIDVLRIVAAKLKVESEESELRRKEQMLVTKKEHASEVWDMKAVFETKMQSEAAKLVDLGERKKILEEQWKERTIEIGKLHDVKVTDTTAFYKKKLTDKHRVLLESKQALEIHKAEFHKKITDSDATVDQECVKISWMYEIKLKEERQSLVAIKEENLSMRSRFDDLIRQIDEHKRELSKGNAEEKKLLSIIKSFENDILGIKREMQERDDTIIDKEKRISDLKKKNQELEKFKFVLDYKIVELRKQVEPREQDIVVLAEKIKLMSEEIVQYHTIAQNMDQQYRDLILKHQATQKDRFVEEWRKNKVHLMKQRIERDIKRAWRMRTNKRALKESVAGIFHKYSGTSTLPPSNPPVSEIPKYTQTEILSILASREHDKKNIKKEAASLPMLNEEEVEMSRTREHYQKTIAMLNNQLSKTQGKRFVNNQRMAQESIVLIDELNELRKHLKGRKDRLSGLNNAHQSGKNYKDIVEEELKTKTIQELVDPEIPGALLPNIGLPPILPSLKPRPQ